MRTTRRKPTAVATVAVLVVLAGCAETVPTPTGYAPFSSKDNRFSCDYPKGWQADGGGNSDYSWAKFTKGPAEIRVDASIAGSLFGDIAKSQNAMLGGGNDPESAPVAQVHAMGQRAMKEEYSNYQEREAKVVQAPLGEGRRSTFIADQALGGKVYGYRATFLGHDRKIGVVCQCPASNWAALKPAFEKVIASLKQ